MIFSEISHQNITEHSLDLVAEDKAAHLSLSDVFKNWSWTQLCPHGAVISSRASSLRKMIEIRKQMLKTQLKLGIQKFSNFSGQSTTARTTVNVFSVAEIKLSPVNAN